MSIGANVVCPNGQVETPEAPSGMVMTESFESAACSGTCWGAFQPNGAINALSPNPTNAFYNRTSYVGLTNTAWSIQGYCLEIDSAGIILSTVTDGSHSAELDCDNGSGTKGNSSISNKNYYAAGVYELRYNYSGRVNYPDYNPTYICGTTATDVAWANSTNTSGSGGGLRSNQINVYFDLDNAGAPGSHTTIDGTQTLAGANLIDVCVNSAGWIERSVKITVTTAGYYWLSFAADGANDSYGGQLDNIRMCRTSCTGSVADNFPGAWPNDALFEDTFDSPTYTNTGSNANSSGLLNSSYGTTSGAAGGWPGQTAVGWSVAPYNQVDYLLKSAAQGAQSIELDGLSTGGQSYSNRTIARPFNLDPGYYRLDYRYISDAIFPSVVGQFCLYAPTASFAQYGYTGMLSSTNRLTGATSSKANDTNSLAVFMAHTQLVSTPNVSSTLNAAATYTNPDGSITSTPTTPPDALNIATYDGTQVNPLLDYCGYSATWMTRTTYIKITKPGEYWLAFSGKGTADSTGPAIDDVKLTALNSLYGVAPSFAVTIPTPGPAPGSSVSYTGFRVTADPLNP